MRLNSYLSIFVATSLSGCATVGIQLTSMQPVTGGEVYAAIICDIKAAVDKEPELREWAAEVSLTFEDKQSETVVPASSLTASFGDLKVTNAGASLTNTYKAGNLLPLVKSYPNLGNELTKDCPSSASKTQGLRVGEALLQQFAWRTGVPKDVKLKPSVQNSGYSESFTVSRKIDGSLSFTMGPVTLKSEGASSEVSRANSIAVTFAFPDPTKNAETVLNKIVSERDNAQTFQRAITQAIVDAENLE